MHVDLHPSAGLPASASPPTRKTMTILSR
jgi:hypothetical protein